MLNSILNIMNKKVVIKGDFNLFFNTSLETQDGNPILKKKYLAKLIEKNLGLFVIYGELGALNRYDFLFLKTAFLVAFKEDWITF